MTADSREKVGFKATSIKGNSYKMHFWKGLNQDLETECQNWQ